MPPEANDAITGRHNARIAGSSYGRRFRGMPAEVLVELWKVRSSMDNAIASRRLSNGPQP